MSDPSSSGLRTLRARYNGRCLECGEQVLAGTYTGYDPSRRGVVCLSCMESPQSGARSPRAVGPFFPDDGVFAVLDTETSGISASRERIVEVAVVTVDGSGRVLDYWDTLVNPEGSVGPTHVHGISAWDVRDAPLFSDVADALLAQFSGKILVAHNLSFDIRFVEAELARSGRSLPGLSSLCTLQAARRVVPEQPNHKLETLSQAFSLSSGAQTHAAGDDAVLTGRLLAHLRTLAGERGVRFPLSRTSGAEQAPPVVVQDVRKSRTTS